MNTNCKNIVRAALATLTILAAGTAGAQDFAGWSLMGGFTHISPQVSSGTLSAPTLPGTKVDIAAASQISGAFTYNYSDDVAFTFAVLSLPFKHDIKGDGSIAGVGKIGTIKQLPPTVFAQYKFLDAKSPVRPYAGLGLTYAYFYGGKGSATLTALTNPGGPETTLSAKSKFALSPQVGVQIPINEKWFFDASVLKTFVKTTTTLSTGQKIDTKLDPIAINIWVGYRF
jgi:outer membrane protein